MPTAVRIRPSKLLHLLIAVTLCVLGTTAMGDTTVTQETHDQLVKRLAALEKKASAFGPAYTPLYKAALPWYEKWGGRKKGPVDSWMVSPEEYANELATALEKGHNYIAENPGASFPLCFEKKLPGGKTVSVNYLLGLPEGFPEKGHKFPLLIGLHGAGWLAHKVSYSRGDKKPGPMFSVTPINEGGPWQMDFLNAYLDELERILPIDPDRVYVEGHSLGAMGTWEWAMCNPERLAAISPRAGVGSPFRAVRMKNVPAWVIHGSEDDAIPYGYAEQMVTALKALGAEVKYSLLKGAPHNMPPDFDEKPVREWYLQHTRSKKPAPADPIDGLGIRKSGISEPAVITVPEGAFWKVDPAPIGDTTRSRDTSRNAAKALFKKVHDHNALVDSQIIEEVDPVTSTIAYWLPVPKDLQSSVSGDKSVTVLKPREVVRFYGRGETEKVTKQFSKSASKFTKKGRTLSDKIWITPLSGFRRNPTFVAEYWVEIR